MKLISTCPLCSGPPHDFEQHAATLSIHRWLRERVRLAIQPDDMAQKKPAAKPAPQSAFRMKNKAGVR